MKTYQQLNAKETNHCWSRIWQPREYNKKPETINNVGKKLEGLEEGPKAKMHIDSPRTTQRKHTKMENARP